MIRTVNEELKHTYDVLRGAGKTKSECFQLLFEMNYEVGDIAYSTKNHYSFVYAICDKTVGVQRKTEVDKTVIIREMADKGLTPGQIAKELNANYNFVHSTVKKHREAQKAV